MAKASSLSIRGSPQGPGAVPSSISRRCIPDVVITINGDTRHRTLVFDAKYRSSAEAILAGFNDMHVYRDAIRETCERSAIDAAFVVTPDHPPSLHQLYQEAYRASFGFGGFDLRPGEEGQFAAVVGVIKGFVRR
jgi:hypothetical protein